MPQSVFSMALLAQDTTLKIVPYIINTPAELIQKDLVFGEKILLNMSILKAIRNVGGSSNLRNRLQVSFTFIDTCIGENNQTSIQQCQDLGFRKLFDPNCDM